MSKSGYIRLSTETAATITGGEAVVVSATPVYQPRDIKDYLTKQLPVTSVCPGPEAVTASVTL